MEAKTQSELGCLMYDNSYVGASSGNMISCLGVFCLCCPLSVPSDQLLLEILVILSMRLILLNFVLYRFLILNVLSNLQLFFLVFVFFLHVMFPSLQYIFLLIVHIVLSFPFSYFLDVYFFPIYTFLVPISILMTGSDFVSYCFLLFLFLQ